MERGGVIKNNVDEGVENLREKREVPEREKEERRPNRNWIHANLNAEKTDRCTMGQNQVILRHQKFTFPRARE